MTLRHVYCRHWASYDVATSTLPVEALTWLENRDRKTLGTAMLAGLDCAHGILAAAKLTESQRETCGLYVAAGLSFDAVKEEINQVLLTLKEKGCGNEGAIQLERDLPPLTGLKVLANAGAFYMAKYTGIRGDGTTFGTTSHAGVMALQAGWYAVASGLCEYALIGAYDTDGDLIRAARAALLGKLPDLISPRASAACLLLQAQAEPGACILSSIEVEGKACLAPPSENLSLQAEGKNRFESEGSHEPDWGAVQVLMRSCEALTQLVSSPQGPSDHAIGIFDTDPYGREARIVWKSV